MARSRSYTKAEKLGAIVIAVRESVPEASRLLAIPQNTIYTWLHDAGGVKEVRELANARAEEALSKSEVAIYEAAARRAAKANEADLYLTYRSLARSRLGDGEAPGAKAGAAANAQVAVHNWNINANE